MLLLSQHKDFYRTIPACVELATQSVKRMGSYILKEEDTPGTLLTLMERSALPDQQRRCDTNKRCQSRVGLTK